MRRKAALRVGALVLALTLGLSGTALADEGGPLNVDTSLSDGDGVGVEGSQSSCNQGGPINFTSLVERFACERSES